MAIASGPQNKVYRSERGDFNLQQRHMPSVPQAGGKREGTGKYGCWEHFATPMRGWQEEEPVLSFTRKKILEIEYVRERYLAICLSLSLSPSGKGKGTLLSLSLFICPSLCGQRPKFLKMLLIMHYSSKIYLNGEKISTRSDLWTTVLVIYTGFYHDHSKLPIEILSSKRSVSEVLCVRISFTFLPPLPKGDRPRERPFG